MVKQTYHECSIRIPKVKTTNYEIRSISSLVQRFEVLPRSLHVGANRCKLVLVAAPALKNPKGVGEF